MHVPTTSGTVGTRRGNKAFVSGLLSLRRNCEGGRRGWLIGERGGLGEDIYARNNLTVYNPRDGRDNQDRREGRMASAIASDGEIIML